MFENVMYFYLPSKLLQINYAIIFCPMVFPGDANVHFSGLFSSTAKLRIWTLRIWGFRGPGFRSARQVLCGDASRLFSQSLL